MIILLIYITVLLIQLHRNILRKHQIYDTHNTKVCLVVK